MDEEQPSQPQEETPQQLPEKDEDPTSDVGAWIKERLNDGRYKTIKGYKLDSIIFQISLWAILAWLFFIAYSYDFQLDYFECRGATPQDQIVGIDVSDAPENCRNPFFKPANWKNKEYLPPGKYGTPPGALFNSAKWVPLLLLGLALSLNHVLHNRRIL